MTQDKMLFYRIHDDVIGPLELQFIIGLYKTYKIPRDVEVQEVGHTEWMTFLKYMGPEFEKQEQEEDKIVRKLIVGFLLISCVMWLFSKFQ